MLFIPSTCTHTRTHPIKHIHTHEDITSTADQSRRAPVHMHTDTKTSQADQISHAELLHAHKQTSQAEKVLTNIRYMPVPKKISPDLTACTFLDFQLPDSLVIVQFSCLHLVPSTPLFINLHLSLFQFDTFTSDTRTCTYTCSPQNMNIQTITK